MTAQGDTPEVILYTIPYCPDCRDLRRYLTEHAVPFREVDLTQTVGAVDEMIRLNGGRRSAPTVRVGPLVLVDPDPQLLDEALKSHGLGG